MGKSKSHRPVYAQWPCEGCSTLNRIGASPWSRMSIAVEIHPEALRGCWVILKVLATSKRAIQRTNSAPSPKKLHEAPEENIGSFDKVRAQRILKERS